MTFLEQYQAEQTSRDDFMRQLRMHSIELHLNQMKRSLDQAHAIVDRAPRFKCACQHTDDMRRVLPQKNGTLGPDGSFIAYASVWGGPDCDNDYIERGAFTGTIRTNGGRVKLLWQHDPREPLGWASEMEEDSHGLKFRGIIELESARGREAIAHLKSTVLDTFSIGYRLPEGGWRQRSGGGRSLKTIELREISVVTWGCNADARIR